VVVQHCECTKCHLMVHLKCLIMFRLGSIPTCVFFLFPPSILLLEYFRKHPYTHHLDSTHQQFTILHYSLLHNDPCFYQSILFFDAFQRDCHYQYTSPLNISATYDQLELNMFYIFLS